MIDVTNANQILALKNGSELFSPNENEAHKEYKMLCKLWHPDVCSDSKASAVFEHLTKLFKKGIIQEPSNLIVFKDTNGVSYTYSYSIADIFDMGEAYLGKEFIIYAYKEEWKGEFEKAQRSIQTIANGIRASPSIQKAAEGVVPIVDKNIISKEDGKGILVFKRIGDTFRLSDVLKHAGSIDQRHSAWIISRLCNILCVFFTLGYSHNGITLDNIFISPKQHSAHIAGGWQYIAKLGSRLTNVSSDVYKIMPISVKTGKEASILTDIESVKSIGRLLTKGQNLPSAFSDWLWSGNEQTPYAEFENWDKALTNSYGKRTFIQWEIPEDSILK